MAPDHGLPRDGEPPALGLFIPEELPGEEALALAVSLEDTRFRSAWFTENDRDPFPRIAAALARTSRLEVGSGIALFSRPPVLAAMSAAELHELSGGRFTFGLGIGAEDRNEGYYGIPHARATSRISEYVQVVRAAWQANEEHQLDHKGGHFTVRAFCQPYFTEGPPILVAAVQARMLRAARRVGDGVFFSPATTPWYCRKVASSELASVAREAERVGTFRRVVCARCAVAADRMTAVEWARRSIAAYGRFPVHRKMYARHGFGEEADAIAAAALSRDQAAGASAVTDAMVEAFAIAGTPDDARRQLHRWDGLVDDVALYPAASSIDHDEVSSNARAIRAAFGER